MLHTSHTAIGSLPHKIKTTITPVASTVLSDIKELGGTTHVTGPISTGCIMVDNMSHSLMGWSGLL